MHGHIQICVYKHGWMDGWLAFWIDGLMELMAVMDEWEWVDGYMVGWLRDGKSCLLYHRSGSIRRAKVCNN